MNVGVPVVSGVKVEIHHLAVFDAIKKAKEENSITNINDTAGRLQNKVNLMKELEKMNVLSLVNWTGADETLLVLDATTIKMPASGETIRWDD